MQVIKRDGTNTEFDIRKIKAAITKTNSRTKEMTDSDIDRIVEIVSNKTARLPGDISVETIQDIVEDTLLKSKFNKTAKSYIVYREERSRIRQSKSKLIKDVSEMILGKSDYWNTENSNKDARVVTTQRDYLAGILSTELSKDMLLQSDIIKAHEEGIIHFHDMDYYAQNALHNCLAAETRFITDRGVRCFNDYADGDTVTVLTKSGAWKKAIVHCYGQADLYDYAFYETKKANAQHVLATENHRWYLKDGSITTNLRIGDKLAKAPNRYKSSFDDLTDAEKLLWCKGFALGDGTTEFLEKGVYADSTRIRLRGDKNKFLNYFNIDGCHIRNHTFANGDHEVVVERYRKEIPEFNSVDEASAFMHGLYCADGWDKTRKQSPYRLQSSDARVIEFIREYAPIAGLYITAENEQTGESANFTAEKGRPYTTLFSFNPEFSHSYTVSDKRFARHDAVWCLEVEDEHNFVLANGIVTGNCDLINLNDMLQNGTMINGIKIDRPHWFMKAATIATQIITAVASSQYGGCSINLSDLAPFVKDSYDKYLSKYEKRGFGADDCRKYADEDLRQEIESAVQTFNYQINSMSTTNGQAPFITVFMYLNERPEYKKEHAMLIEEFLRQRILGMKNEKGVYITPAFPKLIYVLEEDNIKEGSEYYYLTKLAARCTAKRMVPDYISEKIMKSLKHSCFGTDDCYAVMGCRSALTPDRFSKDLGNVANAFDYIEGKPKYSGRFNQGVVTISLPDAAFSSGGDMDKFWKIFDQRLELCHKALRCRHERLKGTLSDVAPILWQDGALARLQKGETIDRLLYDGYSTLSLGYGGLYECVKCMTGHSHTDGAEGEQFGLRVMQYMNDKCNEWKKGESIDYSLYGTPMESTTYKFAKCLKKRFGDDVFVKLDGRDRNYITNSYHVPVFEHIDAFRKLELESKFQRLSPGGAISYIETADLTHNPEAVLSVMKFIYDNIMYAELNTKSDYCQVCGYDGEMKIDDNMHWYCPNCGNTDQHKMNVARRTCGYIGQKYWNYGRTNEIKDRFVHLDNMEDDAE